MEEFQLAIGRWFLDVFEALGFPTRARKIARLAKQLDMAERAKASPNWQYIGNSDEMQRIAEGLSAMAQAGIFMAELVQVKPEYETMLLAAPDWRMK